MRKVVFTNDNYYHVYNRGVDKRDIFTNRHELNRATELLNFYRFENPPLRYSQFKNLAQEKQQEYLQELYTHKKTVDIISYCFMPNHFHLLIKQNIEHGLQNFIANFTNAYTKYFNLRHSRTGHLFQGVFKAVFVETDEQLLHLTRYIHLNPVASSMIKETELERYEWSSYAPYIGKKNSFINSDIVLKMFKDSSEYKKFVLNQVEYAKALEVIKHTIIE